MQIHEITQPDQTQLDEVVGGLARMAGQAIAKSPVGQAVGQVAGAAKQAYQQSTVGQTLQKAGDVERQARVQSQTQAVSKAALQQWNNRVAQLTQASGGQPIDPAEYKRNLSDFVERMMLRSYKIADLDSTSNARVDQALDTVVQARNDRRTLEPAFEKLAQQALASRLDTARTGTQSSAAQATVGTGAQQAPGAKQPAPPLNAPQAEAVVATALRKTGIDLTKLVPELEAAAGGTVKVPKTNNTMANAVLQAMRILA